MRRIVRPAICDRCGRKIVKQRDGWAHAENGATRGWCDVIFPIPRERL